jgi:hypothetical protein
LRIDPEYIIILFKKIHFIKIFFKGKLNMVMSAVSTASKGCIFLPKRWGASIAGVNYLKNMDAKSCCSASKISADARCSLFLKKGAVGMDFE